MIYIYKVYYDKMATKLRELMWKGGNREKKNQTCKRDVKKVKVRESKCTLWVGDFGEKLDPALATLSSGIFWFV